MIRLISLATMLGLLCCPLRGEAQRKAPAKKKELIFVWVQSVKEPKGTRPSLKPRATVLLRKLLRKHPEIVLWADSKMHSGGEVAVYLKKHKMRGQGLQLRITRAAHALHPPKPGKVYKVLMVDVAVAIDTQKLFTGQLALAGEGSASVGVETARLKEKERVELLHEALGVALKQAVSRTVFRMKNPVVTQKPIPRKKRKRRRRRRGKQRKR